MHVNIYKSILYYFILYYRPIMPPTCFSHSSKRFCKCPLYSTSLRMATSVAKACRRHMKTLEQLCTFVGFVTLPKQAFFVQILTHTLKRSEGKFPLHLKYPFLLWCLACCLWSRLLHESAVSQYFMFRCISFPVKYLLHLKNAWHFSPVLCRQFGCDIFVATYLQLVPTYVQLLD